MRKISKMVIFVMIVFLTTFVLRTFASDKDSDQGPPFPPPCFGPPPFMEPPPLEKDGRGEPEKEMGLEGLKDQLGLSDEQLEKIMSAEKLEKQKMTELFNKFSTDLKKLREKVKAGTKDMDLKPLLETLKRDMQNLRENREKWEETLSGLLTPTQQAKMILEGPRLRGFPPPPMEGKTKKCPAMKTPLSDGSSGPDEP